MSNLATTTQSQFSIQSWADLMARADFLSQSGLLPAALKGKKNDVAVILQMGWELGLPPMQAISGINVIQGKPCVSPQLAIAMIYSKVPTAAIDYLVATEEKAQVRMSRDKADKESNTYTATWDMEKARKMQLAGKDNYIKQPGNMFMWRAIGEAARKIFPDVLMGFYFEHEMVDVNAPDDDPNKNKIDEINKTINSDVIDIKPESTSTVEAKQPDHPSESLARARDYVIPFGTTFKGKALKELSPIDVRKYIDSVKESLAKVNREPAQEHLDFFAAAEAFCGPDVKDEIA